MSDTTQLLKTPLHALHVELGGKMVEFAGYSMPVQYPLGVLGEHKHTRAKAGLFDVSHMGQLRIDGTDAAEKLETLTTGDLQVLTPGRMRYTLFTNETGGILDDLMVTNAGDHLFVVVNAACKSADLAHMEAVLGGQMTELSDRALLALQGPSAEAVLSALAPEAAELTFMRSAAMTIDGAECFVTRSGYTGEDGYEISVPAEAAEAFARKLVSHPDVEVIGLGARDSLRLEAGLCLYGHDIDTGTTPVEGALEWAISKRRKAEGGFPGADIILDQLTNGAARRRVGLRPEGRAPAREGTDIADANGTLIGHVTSGGFGPTVEGPIAMGYVTIDHAGEGTEINLMIRGKPNPAKVVALPFVTQSYKR
ncbi:MAG: glycine cleavage system aminomethyltransferase GcvT [Alphaproteobacteria bacterium]|nr:glycine cleavage system aminomethyltransferase GcvT [Alphaproteobacteria bacterium]